MSTTLDILRTQHQAILDYETRREKLLGPRHPEGIREVRRIARAHLELWTASGGRSEDFALSPLLQDKPPEEKPVKLKKGA